MKGRDISSSPDAVSGPTTAVMERDDSQSRSALSGVQRVGRDAARVAGSLRHDLGLVAVLEVPAADAVQQR